MKKLIAFVAVLVLAVCFVSAQGQPQGIHEPGTGQEQPELVAAGSGQGLEDDGTEDIDCIR